MYKKITDHQTNEVSPFIEETVEHVKKGKKTIYMGTRRGTEVIVDSETGEITGHAIFAKRVSYDKGEFRKVYVDSIAAFFDLSRPALKVFGFIISEIKTDTDLVFLNVKRCKEATGYASTKAINTGLSELMDNKFIARGSQNHMYYINPTIFFNGNRVTFLNDYYGKVKKAEAKKLK